MCCMSSISLNSTISSDEEAHSCNLEVILVKTILKKFTDNAKSTLLANERKACVFGLFSGKVSKKYGFVKYCYPDNYDWFMERRFSTFNKVTANFFEHHFQVLTFLHSQRN